MGSSILLFVCCVIVAMLTTRMLHGWRQRPKKWPSAWRLVLHTPALLVPATLTLVVECVLPRWEHWLVTTVPAVTVSATLAGLVGLLGPVHRDRKPHGIHFWLGIKDHFWTFLIAVIAAVILNRLISAVLGSHQTFFLILLAAPSLVFAPLFGAAALYPRRPLRAITATLERVRWDLAPTAWLLSQQIVILVLLWVVLRRDTSGSVSFEALAHGTSVLSFNGYPYLASMNNSPYGPWAAVGITALAMLTSTVYVVKHHRRVIGAPVHGERIASQG